MTKEEKNKYAYELMVKNNPEEAIKNLILKDKLQERINNAIEYIYSHYDLGTEENVEFCLLRDRVLQILKGNKYSVIEILRGIK